MFLCNLRPFCVISSTDGINLVIWWKTSASHWFYPVSNHLRTFVAKLQISRNTRFWQSLSRIFFEQFHACLILGENWELVLAYPSGNPGTGLTIKPPFPFFLPAFWVPRYQAKVSGTSSSVTRRYGSWLSPSSPATGLTNPGDEGCGVHHVDIVHHQEV